MNVDKAIKKVTCTDWKSFAEAKLVNELEVLLLTVKYDEFRTEVTESDVENYFDFEDTRATAMNMIFGGA